MPDFMSLSCKWSLLSCDSCLIDCRKYARYNHAPCKEAECLHFTSFWWQVVSVLSVLVSVTCAECTMPPAPHVTSLFHCPHLLLCCPCFPAVTFSTFPVLHGVSVARDGVSISFLVSRST